MIHWLWLIPAFGVGTLAGIFVIALVSAGKIEK